MEVFAKVIYVGPIEALKARDVNGQHYDSQVASRLCQSHSSRINKTENATGQFAYYHVVNPS